MDNDTEQARAHHYARPIALAVAGVLAGAIAASTFSASAQTPAPSPSPSASSSATPKADSSAPVREDETLLTGTNAEKARAAALKAVPGGTIVRLETDSGPAEYEAHMRKADGTPVTVLMDANFAVTSIEEGRVGGGRHGGRECDKDGDATTTTPSPSGSTTSTTSTTGSTTSA